MKASTALRQARRRAGFTQRQLAEVTGVPQSTIGRIEAGHVDPRVGTLDRLLRACGDELDAVARRGEGVDRSLIREELRHSPTDRLRRGAAAAAGLRRLRQARGAP